MAHPPADAAPYLKGIAPHIPVIDKAGRTDGAWSRADFEWDAENNQYICPEGEALKHTCQACPSKQKCCPNGAIGAG